jgi:hypothetical protein
MCDKCQELEAKTERYRRVMDRMDDPQLTASITALIKEAEAEKAALHQQR